jgi:hypothetical protein
MPFNDEYRALGAKERKHGMIQKIAVVTFALPDANGLYK